MRAPGRSPSPRSVVHRRGTAERVVRNTLLKGAVQATRLLSLIFVILAARALGPAEFGKFTFAYALAALLGAALDLGMHAVLVRSVARAPAETTEHWAAAATLKLLLLVPIGLIFALLPLWTHRPADTTVAVWLLGAALALQSFIELAAAVFTGFERIEFELGLRLVEKLVLIGIGVTGLLLGGGLLLVAGAFAIAAAVSLALGVTLANRTFARLRWRMAPREAWVLARTLGPVAIAFLLSFATTRLVPLVVALVGGDVAAGHFGAAFRVLDVVQVVPVALVAGVYPALARTPAEDPRFRRVTVHAVEVLLLLGFLIALALGFGAEGVTALVYGAPYAATAPLLAMLGIVVCLEFINQFLGIVLLALDRPWRLAAVAGAGLVVSVALTPLLVRNFGAAGGTGALILVSATGVAGSLIGVAPLIGLPLGPGALKVGLAAAGAAGLAALAPVGGWRLGATLLVYGAGVAALRPWPGLPWRRLLRGAAWSLDGP